MRSKWVVFISRKWHTPFPASGIGWIFNLVSILLTLGLCLSLDEFILILALDVLRDCTMPSFQKCLEYEYQQDSGNHRFSFFPFFPFLTCLPALWITVEFSSLPNFILFFYTTEHFITIPCYLIPNYSQSGPKLHWKD